jgi:hypothetical protein
MGSAGETVLSEATLQALTTDVTTERLEAQLVKGRDTPVIAFKIAAVVRTHSPSATTTANVMSPSGPEERETP